MTQMDLFQWADSRPSNVIDARPQFEAKVIAFVQQMLDTNKMERKALTDDQILEMLGGGVPDRDGRCGIV